jgi:hypothetical protein
VEVGESVLVVCVGHSIDVLHRDGTHRMLCVGDGLCACGNHIVVCGHTPPQLDRTLRHRQHTRRHRRDLVCCLYLCLRLGLLLCACSCLLACANRSSALFFLCVRTTHGNNRIRNIHHTLLLLVCVCSLTAGRHSVLGDCSMMRVCVHTPR